MSKKKTNNNRNVGLILLLLLIGFLIYWLATGETKPVEKLGNKNGFNTEQKSNVSEANDNIGAIQTQEDYEMGKRLLEQGNYEEAERYLEQAAIKVLDAEKASDIYYSLGHAQFKQLKFGPARISFTISKHENSDNMIEEIRKAINNPDLNN